MSKNDFDLDFDFEKEYGFDTPQANDSEKLDDDFDLGAALGSDFDEEAALFNSEYQNDFDYGPADTPSAPEVSLEATAIFHGDLIPEEAVPEPELEDLPEAGFEPDELSPDGFTEEEEAPEEDPAEDEDKPVRKRRERKPKEPNKFVQAVIAYFAPEEPKPLPDGRPRKPVSKMRRIKNDILPPAILGLTLLIALIFVFGSAGRAIGNMRTDRENQLSTEEAQKTKDEVEAEEVKALLAEAEELATGYNYDAAIAKLNAFTGNRSKYPEIDTALSTYKQIQASLIEYKDPGAIPNLSFHVLIADPSRAFVNQSLSGKYNMNFVTVQEFERILEQLYANGFVLVDMDAFIAETATGDTVTYAAKSLKLPDGKKPVMLTETMVNYYSYMVDSDSDGKPDKDGAGFASRLVVDSLTGEISAEMVNGAGETVRGDFDMVPVLEKFIDKHPDFCYQGARATLAVSGYDGVFGYRINPEVIDSQGQAYYDEQVAGAKKIVTALRQKGYTIACYTYADTAYGGKSATDIKEDIEKWTTHIVPVIGQVDTLVYAKTSDISTTGAYTGNKYNVLVEAGFRYFISNGNKPACTVTGEYVRQLRVMVTGTGMAHTASMYKDYFDAKTVLDSTRGDVPQA